MKNTWKNAIIITRIAPQRMCLQLAFKIIVKITVICLIRPSSYTIPTYCYSYFYLCMVLVVNHEFDSGLFLKPHCGYRDSIWLEVSS